MEELDSSCLGHRLHHQHPGHDGIPGKVPLEKRLVEGHVLQRNDAPSFLQLQDSIHQKKRIAMRNDLHDRPYIQRFHQLSFLACREASSATCRSSSVTRFLSSGRRPIPA